MKKKTIFWDVDTQFDFMKPEGALCAPGAESIVRMHEKDVINPLDPQADDLLQYFQAAKPMEAIQERWRKGLSALPESVKTIRKPARCPVEFVGFSP